MFVATRSRSAAAALDNLDMAKSSAKYETGVLTLTVTRAAEPKTTKQLTVQ